MTYDVVQRGGFTGLAVPNYVGGDHVELDDSPGHETLHPAGEHLAPHHLHQAPAGPVLRLPDRVLGQDYLTLLTSQPPHLADCRPLAALWRSPLEAAGRPHTASPAGVQDDLRLLHLRDLGRTRSVCSAETVTL